MRSIRMLAAVIGTLALVSACSDGGGTPPRENEAPVANFTLPSCTINVACGFTSTSTDDAAVTTWSWDFNGDGIAEANTATFTYTYNAAGTFNVSLTVTDAEGLTNTKTSPITIAPLPPPVNQLPVADFDLPACTAGTPCGFHSTSTDPDGTIATTAWNFGDTGTGEGTDATHTYAAAGTFTVMVTVTDNQGATATANKQLTVTPPASQNCTTTGNTVACSLVPSQRVTIKIRVESTACELSGNKIEVTAPRQQTAFFNLCNRTPGEEYTVTDAAGAPLVFPAGTAIALRFTQGTAGPGDPATGDPGIRIIGTYPNWSLNIDDGGAAGTGGEPDFDDVVLSVQATLAP